MASRNALEDHYENEGKIEAAASNAEYDKSIGEVSDAYNGLIDASKQNAETQKQIQQEQTDFTIAQVNQQKQQAEKDYTKEQSGAYADWQKQSNQYGVNAEKMASSGMQNMGYSESSQVSMYNQYQNRVMAARESYNKAVLNYDNAITQARLQNSAVLAEIAMNAFKEQAEFAVQKVTQVVSLTSEKNAVAREIKNNYYNRYLAELDQINTENALAENKRQFDASLAFEKAKYAYENNMTIDKDQTETDGGKIDKKTETDGGDTKDTGVKTYSDAVAFMKAAGVPNEYASGVETEEEFMRHAFERAASGDTQYKSYQEYLTDYIEYAIETHSK